MTPQAKQFPFVERDKAIGQASLAPILPISLALGGKAILAHGLVDSGASVNVLPYDVGVQLGAAWDQQTVRVELKGNLTACEARALVLEGTIADFAPVQLVFAWAKSNDVSVLLGQVNFFQEYDICFYRSAGFFEIRSKQSTPHSP